MLTARSRVIFGRKEACWSSTIIPVKGLLNFVIPNLKWTSNHLMVVPQIPSAGNIANGHPNTPRIPSESNYSQLYSDS